MRIGMLISASGRADNDIDDLIEQARTAADAGLSSVWAPQGYDLDTLTALAVVGREVPGMELGATVQPRHPMVVAAQALTAQAATGGRIVLGLGVSHPGRTEPYGHVFDRPVRWLREHLTVVTAILRGEPVELRGETVSASTTGISTDVRGAHPRVPVIVGAIGPAMLRLAGELADGTITFLAGPRTVGAHIVPSITRAAREAGRPAPRGATDLNVTIVGRAGEQRTTLALLGELARTESPGRPGR